MFCNAMSYYGANLCVKASTNIDTNNIFQFLTIFVQNLTILPQNGKILSFAALLIFFVML